MPATRHAQLGRRERQIMEAVYRMGRATVADVLESLEDAPSYSAVRAMLRILESKGHLKHEVDGPRFVQRALVLALAQLGDLGRRGRLRELARQQVVSGEPGRDVDDLAAEPDLLDVLPEDDFHQPVE